MLRPLKNCKWALLGALAITLLSLYPQLVMWATRGREWNGAYAQVHGDEWIYSAYVEALIDGRPRRNDSYTGRDDRPGESQPESIFSIQFAPAYLIAIPARLLGISSSTAFIILGILTPFLSCLAIFWLLRMLTQDDRIAAAGAVIVLCFGAFAGGQGTVRLLQTHGHYVYLPFLRRFAPAASFPLFFVFCGLVWKSLTVENRSRFVWAIAAGAALTTLVFSYFFLWTAALAWLAGLALLWLVARHDLRRSVVSLGIILIMFVAAIIPYSLMVSRRSMGLDAGLKIQMSHLPDLLRVPELFGLVVIAMLAYCIARDNANWRTPEVLFTGSFSLLPFIVFNQQVITGRSMQPFHYSIFIANYVVLVGVVMSSILVWRGRRKVDQAVRYRRLVRLVVLALWWGAVELAVHTRVMMRESQLKDPIAGACQRLREMSYGDVVTEGTDPRPLVLATQDDLAVMLPTFAPQALLWSHYFDFINITREENRRRFYTYLYYSGISSATLREDLSRSPSRFATAVFGVERIIQYVSTARQELITAAEIEEQVRQYEAFVSSFNRETANEHVVSYLVFPVRREPDFTNLDKWYERDTGEQVEAYKICRLRLRP